MRPRAWHPALEETDPTSGNPQGRHHRSQISRVAQRWGLGASPAQSLSPGAPLRSGSPRRGPRLTAPPTSALRDCSAPRASALTAVISGARGLPVLETQAHGHRMSSGRLVRTLWPPTQSQQKGQAGRAGEGRGPRICHWMAGGLPIPDWATWGGHKGLHATIEDFKNDSGQMQGLPVAKAGGI